MPGPGSGAALLDLGVLEGRGENAAGARVTSGVSLQKAVEESREQIHPTTILKVALFLKMATESRFIFSKHVTFKVLQNSNPMTDL